MEPIDGVVDGKTVTVDFSNVTKRNVHVLFGYGLHGHHPKAKMKTHLTTLEVFDILVTKYPHGNNDPALEGGRNQAIKYISAWLSSMFNTSVIKRTLPTFVVYKIEGECRYGFTKDQDKLALANDHCEQGVKSKLKRSNNLKIAIGQEKDVFVLADSTTTRNKILAEISEVQSS